MNVIVFIILVLIVMGLLLYAVELLPLPVAPPYLGRLLQALIVVLAALIILSRVTGYGYAW